MKLTRRSILAGAAALVATRLPTPRWWGGNAANAATSPSIDRQTLVRRHNPHIQKFDPFSALTVGNGTFAFTADPTGLQTFPEAYRKDFPLCTCAHWAWHSTPMPPGMDPKKFRYKEYNAHGRMVGYATDRHGQEPLFDWIRENPHRMHLGQIGLILKHPDGSPATINDIQSINQTIDLWTGTLDSRFTFLGQSVRVQTACHVKPDCLAIRIESPLISTGNLGVQIAFPYPTPEMDMADWNSPARHQTQSNIQPQSADFTRTIDAEKYFIASRWTAGHMTQLGPHEFSFAAPGASAFDLTLHFTSFPNSYYLTAADCFTASAQAWNTFWTTGAAIDLSASTDPRAPELERRIILSQYNTALHCAGPIPPQETGLLFNTWAGKAHLEMHWWHAVHFAAWNRFHLLDRSLGFYHRIIDVGKATAQRQGYAGIRWPKMVGPEGRDSPSPIAPLLIWQQPHPIYYAELSYRRTPTKETLDQWSEIVFGSADFLATYAALEKDRYVLGPPLKSVPEHTDADKTANPTFELAYWRFGLRTAQTWRTRLNLPPNPQWQTVLDHLAPLPQNDGLYLMMENQTDTYTKWNWEHPSLLGACGLQPGDDVDPPTMRRSLQKILDVWQWDRCWGWDFPMAAMTAAKLNEPDLAIRALMIDSIKNKYLPNGHVYQRPSLPAYLPANGGLLAAIAMMAHTNTFPRNRNWSIKSEGFAPLL